MSGRGGYVRRVIGGGFGQFGFAPGAVAIAQILALGHGEEGGFGPQAAVAHIVERRGVGFGMRLGGERAIVGIGHG